MGLFFLDGAETPPDPVRPASDYAREMADRLPPGRLWRLIGGSFTRGLLLGCAEVFARVRQRAMALLDEADPTTTFELLPEHERELDVGGAIYLEERRGRIVARLVARQRFRPVDFQQALAPLLGQDAGDVVVIERSAAFAASIGDQREIYRFFVYRDPTLPGASFIASAQAQLDKMKPSHTVGHVIESVNALYDDPHTLYDRDLLGA